MKILPTALLIFSNLLIAFNFSFPAYADEDTCQTGDKATYAYQLYPDGHCEGIPDGRPISGQFALISFFSGSVGSRFPSSLTLIIPSQSKPSLNLQSHSRNYKVNNLPLKSKGKGLAYDLDTKGLNRADIQPDSMTYLAFIDKNSNRVYLPVVLGKANGSYQFIVNGPKYMKLSQFEIRQSGTAIYRSPSNVEKMTHILTWEYGKAKKGSYELYLKDGEGRTRSFTFEHNPNLL